MFFGRKVTSMRSGGAGLRRSMLTVAAPLVMVATVAWMPAAPAAARTAPAMSAGSFAPSGVLNAVAATSARNAWAVGRFGIGSGTRTLIAHWNGAEWKVVRNPASARHVWVESVPMISARYGWAVGFSAGNFGAGRTIILHWDGTAWKLAPSPSPGNGASLIGVAATSASNAWAVGFTGASKTLIVHWTGTAWPRLPSPSPRRGAALIRRAATSARNAWAVGFTAGGPLILPWNRTTWKRGPSPHPAGSRP